MSSGAARRAWAEVDLSAVRHNAGELTRAAAPAALCAVVKANAYGHGAVPVGRAALEGGAQWLAVALVDEAVELRDAGIEAPVLVLSEPGVDAFEEAARHRLALTLYTLEGVDRAQRAAEATGVTLDVHVKVDTGMHRVGCDASELAGITRAVVEATDLRLQGLWTHLAAADEPDLLEATSSQLDVFDTVVADFERAGQSAPLLHAANTAGALAHARSRYGMVRCGIGLYGYPPVPAAGLDLRPVMSLKASVAYVRTLDEGERVSYGLRYRTAQETQIATVPIGYADGVPRRLSGVLEVLIGGSRCPVAGTITMDQLMVDCGPDAKVTVGDEVVLLGRQGDELITADEWAAALGTISYEVLCGIGPRVPRVHR